MLYVLQVGGVSMKILKILAWPPQVLCMECLSLESKDNNKPVKDEVNGG